MNTRAVIIGEAYGRSEAMFGHAFVGSAGRELALMCAKVGLLPMPTIKCSGCREIVAVGDCPHCAKRNYVNEMDMIRHWKMCAEVYGIALDNVFHERPPNNKIELFFGLDGIRDPAVGALDRGKYVLPKYFPHVEALWKRLSDIKPNLIIALGNTACWATLGQTKISVIRGTLHASKRLGAKVLPTYHPAAMLRNWALRVIILADLEKASREIAFPEIRRVERWITTHDYRTGERLTLGEIEDWLDMPASSYAVDIESGYALFNKRELEHMTSYMRTLLSSQISMVGFARDPAHALVVPFMDRNMPGLNYWPDANDEARAWSLVARGVRSQPPKIFQNGNYDIGRFLDHGITPRNCVDDTMLKHHSLYPELLKSLGFLASVYSDEISWKQMYANRETLKRDD